MDSDDFTDQNKGVRNGPIKKNQQDVKMISQWSRDDLEDKYLTLHEDNLVLKKHARKQEERIKKMATKLLRLGADQSTHRSLQNLSDGNDANQKIAELERINRSLKDKITVLNNQLTLQSKSKQYDMINSRVDTGLAKNGGGKGDGVLKSSLRVYGPGPTDQKGFGSINKKNDSEDLRVENYKLKQAITRFNEELLLKDQEIEDYKEKIRIKDSELEGELLRFQRKNNAEARQSVEENLDFIKLQRDLKEKSASLAALHAKYQTMEHQMATVEATNSQLVSELDRLNMLLGMKEEQRLKYESESKITNTSKKRILELEHEISDLKTENQTLREANDTLTGSAFNMEHERQWQAKERALKAQLSQLESTLRRDVGEKGNVLDKLEDERRKTEIAERDLSQLRIHHFELQEKYEQLSDRMKYLNNDSGLNMDEVEEAIVLVRQKNQSSTKGLEFLQKVDEGENRDFKRRLQEVESSHAESIAELEKARNMLIVQYKLNNDYKVELDTLSRQLEETRCEKDAKLTEYAKLLDIRASRIRKLEQQLRDVAYGTRQYTIKSQPAEREEDLIDEEITLQRGENLLEIHIGLFVVSTAIQETLFPNGEEGQFFFTLDVYDFETQSTRVINGTRPDYNMTMQYPIKVDDFFLHWLQKGACNLELHRAVGTNFETIGAAQLICRNILDPSHEQKGGMRIHSSVQLIGIAGDLLGVNIGSLEYWVRLRVPMATALRLYRERTKALGYITSNSLQATEAAAALSKNNEDAPISSEGMNELHIKVMRCEGLQSHLEDNQPSPYVMYRFYSYPDHDTEIVPSTNNPQFHDHRVYPIAMDNDLDKFLRTQSLKFYVFDDKEEGPAYLGLATVPLLPLAHDKPIKGQWELQGMKGEVNGVIQLEIQWQGTYLPSHPTAHIVNDGAEFSTELLPGEEEEYVRVNEKKHQQQPIKLPAKESEKVEKQQQKKAPLPKRPPSNSSQRQSPPGSDKKSPSETEKEKVVERVASVQSVQSASKDVSRSSSAAAAIVKSSQEPTSQQASRTPTPSNRKVPTPPQEGKVNDEIVSEMTSVTADSGSRTMNELQNQSDEDNASIGDDHPFPDEVVPTPQQEIKRKTPTPSPRVSSGAGTDSDEIVVQRKPSSARSNISQRRGADPRDGGSVTPTEDKNGLALSLSGTLKSTGRGEMVDTVVIAVNYIDFNNSLLDLSRGKNRMVYVAYEFLDLPEEETETPDSLRMPPKNAKEKDKKVTFNFSKTFSVDFNQHYSRRQLLARMLLKDDPTEGKITFTVIDDPDSQEDEESDKDECEELGKAKLSLREIYKRNKDWEGESIPVFSINKPQDKIATLNVTVKCLAALKAIVEEMPNVDLCLT